MKKRNLILSVDFDGTICQHMFPAIGPAMPGAFETLKRFQEKGDRLILWTCREGMYLKEAITFCKLNGIEFEQHNNNVIEHDYDKSRKVYSDLYIDDRMVGGFPGWKTIEKYVDFLRIEIADTPSSLVPPAIEIDKLPTCYCGKPIDESNPECVKMWLCTDHKDNPLTFQ
jgi:hypothetical protein